MGQIDLIFSSLASIMTGVINVITSSFTGVTSLWINTSGTTPEMTLLGNLSLVAFTFGIVWLAIRFIGSMISLKQARR